MPHLPSHITFTGVDERTDVHDLLELQRAYPVEFGVLMSASRTGNENRYPRRGVIDRLAESRLNLSAHICGGWSQRIMEGDSLWEVSLQGFSRVQVNHRHPSVDALVNFQMFRATPVIAQYRTLDVPEDGRIQWLFDPSGGRGLAPGTWPQHRGFMVGYAGGITPLNVASIVQNIAATNREYWIDMESGVRTNDWFDLYKCYDVCRAVYGEAGVGTS